MHGPYGLADTSSCKDNITLQEQWDSALSSSAVAEWKENVNGTVPLSTIFDALNRFESVEA